MQPPSSPTARLARRILMPPSSHSSSNGHLAIQQHSAPMPTPYSPNLEEGGFCELLRHYGVLGSSLMRSSASLGYLVGFNIITVTYPDLALFRDRCHACPLRKERAMPRTSPYHIELTKDE